MFKRMFFLEWIAILSVFFVSFNIVEYAYFKGKSETAVSKIIAEKFIDSYGRYTFVSEDRHFVEVSFKIYNARKINEEYKDFWIK